jgi:hypothetical protein
MLEQILEYKTVSNKTAEQASSLVKGRNEEGFAEPKLILFLEMMTRQVEILAREFAEHFSFEEVATFHMNIRIVKTVYTG